MIKTPQILVKLEPLINSQIIKQLMLKENIYQLICNTTESLDSWQPDFTKTYWYQIQTNNQVIGIFLYYFFLPDLICFHGGVFNQYRHQFTPYILQQILNQIKSSYNTRFITTIHKHNIQAEKFILKCGFKAHTRIENTNIFIENN